MKVDPITFAVIKSGLDSVVDDMAYTVVRIARSEIVKDVMDFSAALCDADGQMVAQAKTIALHLGAVPEAIAAVLAKFGDELHEGDAVIMNDPYHGGMHLPDIFMFVPLFYGGKRRAFAVVICHHTDVGGRVPGSNASDSTEIYQEGLRIPPLKLYARGVLNDTLETLIKINVRVPDRVWGDLQAQYAAAQVGARGLNRLFARYGADDVVRYMHELIDYAERMTREEIRQWPKGTYSFVDYMDSDGFTDAPIPIKVAVTVNEDSLTVDYAGSSPQVRAALNSTRSYTQSCTYLSVRCVLNRDIPNNVGVFRCIEVKVPNASVLDPVLPGACAARALTGYRIFDTMLGALAQIVPHRVPAAGEGGNSVVCISGLRKDRKPFIIVDMICGAWGGRPDKDGVEAITNPSQNLSNMPVEVMEAEHPVRVEEYAFVPDSCGAGLWRGGLGIKRSYRVLADEALLQLRTDRTAFAPYGLKGGEPGGLSRSFITADGKTTPLPGKVTMRIGKDTLISHEQAGGGGYGDPKQRDRALVRQDIADEKISPAYARKHYGLLDISLTTETALTGQPKALRHPGPVDPNRIDSFEGRSRSLDFALAPGVSLIDAVAGPLDVAGLKGAGVTFKNVRFRPFRYVLPAHSPDAEHVAYYSATHAPAEEIEIVCASLTYGRKDDGPFLHCHATWRDRTGRMCGGHVLPLEAFVSAPGHAIAFGTDQVAMLSKFDPETNFTLFRPVAAEAAPVKGKSGSRCILARLKPNVDLIGGIEETCRRHGIRSARVRSGVGSIVGAEFEDGRIIHEHPTEILALAGHIAPDRNGQPRADLSIAVIDMKGSIHEGKPVRGRNPVLICFELALEASD